MEVVLERRLNTPVGSAWGKLGWRTTFRNPPCTDDGQGHETRRGLQGINVERRFQGLSPGLCKAQGEGVKGGMTEAEEERGRGPSEEVSGRRGGQLSPVLLS